VRFKNELERNITIKLGYANAKIYKCEDEQCPRPMCYKCVFILHLPLWYQVISIFMSSKLFYRAYGSGKEDSPMCDVPGFDNCKMKLLRHVSFVDCPVRSWTYTCYLWQFLCILVVYFRFNIGYWIYFQITVHLFRYNIETCLFLCIISLDSLNGRKTWMVLCVYMIMYMYVWMHVHTHPPPSC